MKISEQIAGKAEFVVYVGRFSPIHLGHQALISSIIEAYPKNHVIFLGSCNHTISCRHLFSAVDRTEFIKRLFPSARVTPLPDFDKNEDWFAAMDFFLKRMGYFPQEGLYLGGCKEDVDFYGEYNRKTHIINRFSSDLVMNVSATEVRDALFEKRYDDLKNMVDPKIINFIIDKFQERWQELKKR